MSPIPEDWRKRTLISPNYNDGILFISMVEFSHPIPYSENTLR